MRREVPAIAEGAVGALMRKSLRSELVIPQSSKDSHSKRML